MMTQWGNSYSFTYNGLGDKVSQTANSVTTTYTLDLNASLTQVLAASAGTSTYYLYGVGRIREQGNGNWFHLADALGSVRQLTNATGVVSLVRNYQPFGSVLSSSGSAATA